MQVGSCRAQDACKGAQGSDAVPRNFPGYFGICILVPQLQHVYWRHGELDPSIHTSSVSSARCKYVRSRIAMRKSVGYTHKAPAPRGTRCLAARMCNSTHSGTSKRTAHMRAADGDVPETFSKHMASIISPIPITQEMQAYLVPIASVAPPTSRSILIKFCSQMPKCIYITPCQILMSLQSARVCPIQPPQPSAAQLRCPTPSPGEEKREQRKVFSFFLSFFLSFFFFFLTTPQKTT
ncbi:hypothetical protein EV426DRAFT_229012 [Tirmania nivea]|nr:hypothetical protein EV426DRAFT_229012 [Tirmania nivea]